MRLRTKRTAHPPQYAKISIDAIVGLHRNRNTAGTRRDELTRLASDT